MSRILEAALKFRRELVRGEDEATKRLIGTYQDIVKRLEPSIVRVLDVAKRDGELDSANAFRVSRLDSILSQVRDEVETYSQSAGKLIESRQEQLALLAQRHARDLANVALPPDFKGSTWKYVASEQLKDLIGFARDGSPLHKILKEVAPDATNRVRDAFLQGVGSGQTPTQIINGVREHLGGNMARMLTIVRTEDMRAYRSSTLRAFQENNDVIDGWVWVASLTGDACAMCIAMHGTEHDINDEMDSHPNCRCVQAPKTKSYSVLGYGARDLDLGFESGEDWFARQSTDTQQRVLGGAKFAAYQDGKISLADCVKRTQNRDWGGSRHVASLDQALKNADK